MKYFNYFIFCTILLVTIGSARAQDNCIDLPLEVGDAQALISNGVYINHFALTPEFNCTQNVFVNPARGTSGYSGTSIVVRGAVALTYQFTFSEENTSADSVICATGDTANWRFLKFQITENGGGYFCIFVCSDDGTSFIEFNCSATDSSFFDAEAQAVASVSQVPNGAAIYDAISNCPAPQHCATFN